MWNPAGEAVPYIDILVAEQSVDLLDRVLGHQTSRLRQCLADYRDRQRRRWPLRQRRPGQGIDPLGMKLMAVNAVNK